MGSEERRLDGNAAAGLLGEIFPFEMTMVKTSVSTTSNRQPSAGLRVTGSAV